MNTLQRASKRAFTLIELLVVVAIIALLISILLPSLRRAREQTKAVKCLSNLRSMGQGVFLYVNTYTTLPGPLHPALYRNQGLDYLTTPKSGLPVFDDRSARYAQTRFLTFQLKSIYNDSSSQKDSMTDDVTTCPTMAGIVPDDWFSTYSAATAGKYCFPTHYVLNNYLPFNVAAAEPGGGSFPTNPPVYFGYSSPSPPWGRSGGEQALMDQYTPRPIEQVRNPGREWMVADAWYRKKIGASPALSQEGPYQSEWSGTAFPNYAPHGVFYGTFDILDSAQRQNSSSQMRRGRKDGKTNTLYFDSHAEPVPSKVGSFNGFELLYGFPCTVNPQYEDAKKIAWE